MKADIYWKDDTIGNFSCIVAKTIDKVLFRRVELVSFIIVAESLLPVTRDIIQDFSSACMDYSHDNYDGRGLGYNSGIVSLSMLLGNNIHPEAQEFCRKPAKRRFASRQINVVYDVVNGQFYYYSGWQIWGALLFPYYRALRASTMEIVRNAITPAPIV